MQTDEGGAGASKARELEQVLALTVRRLGGVSTGALRSKLPKPFQRPRGELEAALRALAERGEIFAHPKAKTKFLARDARSVVRSLALEALGERALSESEVKARVAAGVKGLGLGAGDLKPLVAGALRALVRDGDAFAHRPLPPGGGRRAAGASVLRYARSPQAAPDPRPYVRKAAAEARRTLARLAPFGTTAADLLRALAAELGEGPVLVAASQPEGGVANSPAANGGGAPGGGVAPEGDGSTLLRALDEVAAGEPPGALLLVREVRARAGLDKAAFDRAALALVAAERVVLHHHDHPASLTDDERAAFVVDGRGTHYLGIARRRGTT